MRRCREDPTEWSGEIYSSESMELCLDPVRVCVCRIAAKSMCTKQGLEGEAYGLGG